MGTFGEDCAAKYKFTREAQDAFATASVQRAKKATESGAFAAEIVPVVAKGRAGERVISIDEGPGKVKLDKIPTLKPAFKKDGSITAASSSSINDGAAALVIMTESTAKRLGLKPLARIVPTPRTRRSRSGSPPPRSAPRRSCSPRPAGMWPTSTCGK